MKSIRIALFAQAFLPAFFPGYADFYTYGRMNWRILHCLDGLSDDDLPDEVEAAGKALALFMARHPHSVQPYWIPQERINEVFAEWPDFTGPLKETRW